MQDPNTPTMNSLKRQAFDAGKTDARKGREAHPGCPTSIRGKAYMRGYIAGAGER